MKFYDYLIEKGKEDGIEKNVVGAVIVNEKNEVLIMSRKADDFMGGIDELPSGNMEKGEDILKALTREVKEETNLDLKEVICFINSFDYISGSGKKARQYNFAIKVEKNGVIKLTEHDAYKWESLQEARDNAKITDEVKECLEIYNFNNKSKMLDFECHFCATACILNKEKNKILFIHHKKLNKWLFVGGHIEENENPEEAVLREVKEETNLDIELIGQRYPRQEDFIKPFALQKNIVKENHIHMDIFYVAIDKGTSKLKEKEDEVLGSKWFSKEQIISEDFDTFPEKKKMAIDVLEMFK
ncbi:MAG: NUDIX domain-containing protein [Clostridia bacterium]